MTLSISGTSSAKTYNIDHGSALLQFANQSRIDGDFNDITICVEENNISAHKLVLSCFSNFFKTMFTTEMKEKYKDSVAVQDVDFGTMEALVEFMYTGRIEINGNNACNILAVSDYLQMESARILCIEYLAGTISVRNCLTTHALVDRYDVPELKSKVNQLILDSYKQIISFYDFQQLSKDQVVKLIEETHKKVCPDLVYTAVMNWVKWDVAAREGYLNELIKFIDSDGLTNGTLGDVDAIESLLRKQGDWIYEHCLAMAQRFKNKESSIISVGESLTLNKVFKYDLQTQKWSQLPNLPVGRYYGSAVVIDNVLYYFGGCIKTDGKRTVCNIVHRMDLKKKKLEWKEAGLMNVKRYAHDAAVLNGSIFTFGGRDHTGTDVSSGECCVVPLNEWVNAKPLQKARSCHSVVVFQDRLYILCGWKENKVTSSVECYDPTLESWTKVASMQTPRKWFAAVVMDNAIYALAGHDGEQTFKSVEKYNVNDGTWSFVSEMNVERHSFAACVAQNKIYVVGGLDFNLKVVTSIECYDPQTDKWSIVGETEAKLFDHSLIAV